ncbi:ribonuclease activity regulator protein RraA [Planoprotostelium fungivorum]|uniref:4-hydroxy-4-methyl-2-oxoglutarate aldolase n=1 Tax=Planoprotostelium fungivorum TaxID=1890364 RepID=A0A2P6N035_9EUKA|nr:ribonuclease activity regulator protein RraA [Planoprotostelium fungivorum]
MSTIKNIVTADICDAYEGEIHKNFWVVDPSLQWKSYGSKSTFAGEVVTVKVFEDNSLVKDILATPGKGKVLVVDGGGSARCALVGDQIAAGAAKNGWEGVLVYGYIRDAKEISAVNIHIKALGTNPLRSIKKGRGDKDIAVVFGGVAFKPGQFIYADEDGIVLSSSDVQAKL